MGLFSKVLFGVDLDEEQAKSDSLDAKLGELNREAYESGKHDEAWFEEVEQNRQAGALDVHGEVRGAFMEGLSEGIDRIRNTVGGIVSGAFSLVPWQLWILGGVALFVYAGGGLWLRGLLTPKKT